MSDLDQGRSCPLSQKERIINVSAAGNDRSSPTTYYSSLTKEYDVDFANFSITNS